MEETHYYPFGLTMAGISSRAAGGLENRKKYNGIEFDEDLDIDSYEAFYRNLDPQIGRWWQIDPMGEPNEDSDEPGLESLSPYNSMANNPVKLSDPLGDLPCCVEAMQILQQADILSTQIVQFGGGPADVVTDAAATVVVVGGTVLAGISALWELTKNTTLSPPATPPKAVATTPAAAPPKAVVPVVPHKAIAPPKAVTPVSPSVNITLNAHGKKKQSTGSTKKSGDNHMRQYKNPKKGNNKNPNERKGAAERRNKAKPID